MTTRTPDPAHWLTLDDAATELGFHPETIRRQINSGLMPGKKIGRHFRIARAEWEEYRTGRWKPAPRRIQPQPTSLVATKRSA